MDHTKTGPRYLFVTSLAALGVVFGDIGTSPLYAFRESFEAGGLPVTGSNVLGVLSLIFWSLVVVVALKYLVFVLRADNHGEGGILALTALAVGPGRPDFRAAVRALFVLGVFGAALLYGDGVITPAISILSAVEGVGLVTTALQPYVVPISALIMAGLFAVQKKGTGSVGAAFGPVMVVWFTVLAVLGVGQIVSRPEVLEAVNPGHALTFVVGNPFRAFLTLGAIFLVVTGSEALYADMGHFGKRPVRLAWFVMAFPALLLNYFGQGALLLRDPEAVHNPFYAMAPDWSLVPMVLLATCAAIIASQALISGAFSLTYQAVQLGLLPRMKIDHTSDRMHGQIYIASVNWALMLACLVTVVGFGSSASLAAAYGIAVTSTMVVTTILLHSVMRTRWQWNRFRAGLVTGAFLTVDLTFFGSNLLKFAEGGWFPILLGFAVMAMMLSWRTGRRRLVVRLERGQLSIERFIQSITSHPQVRVPGTGVYLFPEPGVTPPALLTNLRNNGVLHETILLVAVTTDPIPRVHRAARATVHDLGEEFYQVVLKYGFMESVDVPGSLQAIGIAGFGFDASDAVYILGKESVIPPTSWRWVHLRLFALMHRNATNAARYFRLPARDVLEVGSQVEL